VFAKARLTLARLPAGPWGVRFRVFAKARQALAGSWGLGGPGFGVSGRREPSKPKFKVWGNTLYSARNCACAQAALSAAPAV
jgi:hypothetical protein